MKNVLFYFLVCGNFLFSQQNNIEALTIEKDRVERIISLYKDSLEVINDNIHDFEQENFKNSLEENPILLYSVKDGLLKDSPSIEADVIYKLPLGAKLIVKSQHGTYYEVKSIYGEGYISLAWIQLTQPSISSNNYSNSIKSKVSKTNRNYSSRRYKSTISRSYYKGPRGGCYYINSNGNKTYVSRSMCN